MDLTDTQRRTLDRLIGTGPAPSLPAGLAERVRRDLETHLAALGVSAEPGAEIWLSKSRLTDRERCDGLFAAALSREGLPFEHSEWTAAGALFHKALEVDVGTERGHDPRSVCEHASERLAQADRSFERYWSGLTAFGRADLMTEAGRRVMLFRDSFPPLLRRWAPQPELRVRVRLAGGVVLSGAPDLVLGVNRRLAIDFKSSGRARCEYAEDMRFYALLFLLRTGVPPYRVATFFLDSGEWQPEDVTEETIERAAERVAASAGRAWALLHGELPDLRPGLHCDWCPRLAACPAVGGRVA